MVKQEPTAYSWSTFVAEGGTAWTGVRSFQARKHLQAMQKGDLVLFYHSVVGKEVVGIAKVRRDAYPDSTSEAGEWICVDLVPVRPLKRAVSLAEIKAHAELREIALVRQSRLSVIPLSEQEYSTIVEVSG
jgi:predicted RNA-binding protein with PUA-like domain